VAQQAANNLILEILGGGQPPLHLGATHSHCNSWGHDGEDGQLPFSVHDLTSGWHSFLICSGNVGWFSS